MGNLVKVKAKHGGQLLRHDDDNVDCDGNGFVRRNCPQSERILWLTTVLLQHSTMCVSKLTDLSSRPTLHPRHITFPLCEIKILIVFTP